MKNFEHCKLFPNYENFHSCMCMCIVKYPYIVYNGMLGGWGGGCICE